MFKRFSIYIDIVTSPNYYALILSTLESFTNVCEPITNVSNILEKPNFTYNLLIIEYDKINIERNDLKTLTNSYKSTIVINVPHDPKAYDTLFEAGIRTTLRTTFFDSELIAVIKEQMRFELLNNENTLLDNMFNSAQNSIVITDRKGNIQYANPYFETVSEYKSDELLENSPNILKSGQHEEAFYKNLWDTITRGKVWEGIFINKSKSAQTFYEEATITPVTNTHGTIEKFLKIGKNITREKMLLEELSKEVKVAKKVLHAFLPAPYSDSVLDFDYFLTEFNQIGGDFIYFKKTSADKYHYAIIDVMGHGISSSLIAMTVIQMFDDLVYHLPLEATIHDINRMLYKFNQDDSDSSIFVTGIFMEIDSRSRSVKYINTGHPDALIQLSDRQSKSLSSNNMIMGVLAFDTVNYTLLDYDKTLSIITYTDGLYENVDYTLDQMIELFKRNIGTIGKASDLERLLPTVNHPKDDATGCIIRF